MTRAWMVAVAMACVACGEVDVPGEWPWEPEEDSEKPVYACEPVPTNNASERAELMKLDTAHDGRYCRRAAGGAYFWRIEGQFDQNTRWRLRVEWRNGLQAEDLDFRMGVGAGASGTVVSGSCTNPAGQPEECVVQIPQTGTDLTIIATAAEAAKEEVFTLLVTRAPDPPMP